MIGSTRITTIQPTIAQPLRWLLIRSHSAQPHSRMNGVASKDQEEVAEEVGDGQDVHHARTLARARVSGITRRG